MRPSNPWAVDNKYKIFTPVHISVDTYLKDAQTQQRSELLIFAGGGVVGKDSFTWATDDLYTFYKGEQVLLFLYPARTDEPLKAIGNQPLWEVVDRYTVKDGKLTNTYYNDNAGRAGSSLSLEQVLSDVKDVVAGRSK